MSLSSTTITNMPSENSFKKQAEIAREALKNFNAIRVLNAPGMVKTALFELVEAVVSASLILFFLVFMASLGRI